MNPHRLFVTATVLAAAAACQAYDRTNPLDPEYAMEVTILGPDSVFSVNDTVQFHIQTEPSHSGLPFVWSSGDVGRFPTVETAPPGVFTSRANGTVTIRATLGGRTVEKEVVISQKPVKLMIAPPPTTDFVSLGDFLNLSAAIVDAKSTPVQGATTTLEWSSSNANVVEVVNGRATARANGSAWVKASSLGQADSVRLTVQQVPATLQFGNANYTIGIPGGSVQTALTTRDARGNPIPSPQGLAVTSSRSTFQVNATGLVQSSGFGSTVITAQLGELTATTNVRVVGGTAPVTNAVEAAVTSLGPVAKNFLLIELTARDSELDLDEATLEVYSTADLWMLTRVIPLEQGTATDLAVLAVPNAGQAGTVRVRLRDAALNSSAQTVWDVATQPTAESPDISIESVVANGSGGLSVRVQATRGDADLRNVHVVGLAANGEVVVLETRPASTDPVTVTLTPPGAPAVVTIGAVATDIEGGVSPLRLWSLTGSN